MKKILTSLIFILFASCAEKVVTVTEYVEAPPEEVRYTKLIDETCFSETGTFYEIPVHGYKKDSCRHVATYISRADYPRHDFPSPPNQMVDGVWCVRFTHDGSYRYVGDTLVVIWTNQTPL